MKGATLEDWLELAATDWFPAAATAGNPLPPPMPRNQGGPGGVMFHNVVETRTVYVPVVVGGPGPHGMLRA